jgi:hypothetical protein
LSLKGEVGIFEHTEKFSPAPVAHGLETFLKPSEDCFSPQPEQKRLPSASGRILANRTNSDPEQVKAASSAVRVAKHITLPFFRFRPIPTGHP